MALAATLPPSRVAKQLRWRLIDLKKPRAAPHAAPSLPLSCVEVPSAPARPQPAVATQRELSRADGTRLCLHTPLSPLLLDALVRAFVEGRSCCN